MVGRISSFSAIQWRPPELVQVFWAFSSLQLDEVDYQHLPLKPQLTGVDLRSAVGPGKIFSRRWGATGLKLGGGGSRRQSMHWSLALNNPNRYDMT